MSDSIHTVRRTGFQLVAYIHKRYNRFRLPVKTCIWYFIYILEGILPLFDGSYNIISKTNHFLILLKNVYMNLILIPVCQFSESIDLDLLFTLSFFLSV